MKKVRKKGFMVIGLGRFGSYVAKTLANMKADVLAIDKNEQVIESMKGDIHNILSVDTTSLYALKQLDLKQIDHAIVAIGNNLQDSILTVTNLKELGVPRITVLADQEGYKKI